VNKTLLIIICDFLLISILALVEFRPELEPGGIDEQALRENAAEEMLELLQLSLEHEAAQRQSVEDDLREQQDLLSENLERLDETSRELEERQRSLEQVSSALKEREAEKEALAGTLEATRGSLEATRGSLELTREEKAALARELEQNEARARRLQEELRAQQELTQDRVADLEAARENLTRLEAEQRQLSTRLQIRETEKEMLEQNLVAARAEVERARVEAERAGQRSETLAAGVSELAATSTALQEEFRQAQPLSMNAIYRRFEDNRVFLRFAWRERLLLGSASRQAALQSIMVDTGAGVHAIFATANTPLSDPARRLDPSAVLTIGQRSFAVREVGFLAGEPAIAAVRVPDRIVEESGLQVFALAREPLRFGDAVLVSDDQEVFGEIPVRVPPGEPGLLEIESRLFNRLFGEFSPSPGDYVFSKTGELMGLMVRPNRARLLENPAFSDFQPLADPSP
jgi:hypothetical protein